MIGAFSSPLPRSVMWRVVCWLLGGLLGLLGCTPRLPYPPSSPSASPPQLPAQWQFPAQYEDRTRATYQLAAGDRVRLISWSVPELSREVQVGADGTFVYPYVGTVRAGGRTVVQLETDLGQRLAALGVGQLDPHALDLRADLIDYSRSQVAVLGEVRMPGVYPWQPDATPMALIAQAGGLTANAWFVALLIRAAPPQPLTNTAPSELPAAPPALRLDLHKLFLGEGHPTLRLAGGDTLYVPSAGVYQVLGCVKNPGQYRLQRETTVLQALAQAGGLTALASTNRLMVWRYHVHNATCGGELCLRHVARFVLDELPQAFRMSLHDVIQPGDVLMATGLWC